MKVLKFGGTSVATPDRVRHIADLISKRLSNSEKLTMVCSAFAGVTDKLVQIARLAEKGKRTYAEESGKLRDLHLATVKSLLTGDHQMDCLDRVNKNFDVLENLLKGVLLVREASPRTMDYILSFGELNSCQIIASYFKSTGLKSKFVDGRDIIKTNKDFGGAKVVFRKTNELIHAHYGKWAEHLNIVTGFVAADVGGLTTTLGRGGSDYTAAIIASALHAESLEIWTDVDGVLTSNPKIVPNAYTIPQLSYDEAMELSHFGAKVIYPPTIQPALVESIPIYIKNTFNPQFEGTLITSEKSSIGQRRITGVTALSNVVLMTIEGSGLIGVPGMAARLFNALGKAELNVVMITQASSEHSICFAVMDKDEKEAHQQLIAEFERELEANMINPISIERDLSLVAVVGENMKSVPGVAGSLFRSLGRNGINVVAIAQGSSELNITFAIKQSQERKALNLVHDAFFLSENKTLNIFLVGVGLIGSTLLSQINDQKDNLKVTKRLDTRIIGIANTKKMVFNKAGLSLDEWKDTLSASAEESSLDDFVNRILELNLPNSIFIDCTANTEIKKWYPKLLSNSVSISTANKVAASSQYSEYQELKDLALKHNVQFMYETNVGAGLPVIRTIENLVKSGDEVECIEAVISGSLSYIFNNYKPDVSFKDLIHKARELGLTEPDPRDDLSGQDIKRKIIILTRVAGYHVEPEEVEVEAILPDSCLEAETIDDFFLELEKHDDYFRSIVQKASDQGQKIRYVASMEKGKAKIKLAFVSKESPFFNLLSTDNMVVIKTKRYQERPLVIQGPGAGADVTAAGVFAEIIELGNMVGLA